MTNMKALKTFIGNNQFLAICLTEYCKAMPYDWARQSHSSGTGADYFAVFPISGDSRLVYGTIENGSFAEHSCKPVSISEFLSEIDKLVESEIVNIPTDKGYILIDLANDKVKIYENKGWCGIDISTASLTTQDVLRVAEEIKKHE